MRTSIEEFLKTAESRLEQLIADTTATIENQTAELNKLLTKTRKEITKSNKLKKEADAAIEEANRVVTQSKDEATANGEAWINVIKTHVNPSNIRNGFFELDWNEIFIQQLRTAGYGETGDSDETIIDLWFKDLVYNMMIENDINPLDRNVGYLNISKLGPTTSAIG